MRITAYVLRTLLVSHNIMFAYVTQQARYYSCLQTYLVPRLGGEVALTYLSMEHQTATHKRCAGILYQWLQRGANTVHSCKVSTNCTNLMELRRLGAWPREAGPPCFVNPFMCESVL